MTRLTEAVCALLLSSPALAQSTVDLQFDEATASKLGIDTVEAENEIRNVLDEQLRAYDIAGFLTSMADAGGIAGKGIGVDYATNPKDFVFGISVGTGANASGFVFGRGDTLLPEAGFALQASMMGGINLGLLTKSDDPTFLDRVVVTAHGLGFNGAQREFQGSMYNFGGHVQVKVIGKAGVGLFEWGGLDVTSGFERVRYKLALSRPLPLTTSLEDGTELGWDATGTYSISVTDDSIPLELSTNLRISVVSLFFGGAGDWHTGSALAMANLDGPVTGAAGEQVGSARLTISADQPATPFSYRFFTGLQINVLPVKVYAQINVASTQSVGAHAGIRFAM